uniref:ShKT domain-containing protein n=1 Tax=Rhabditophanes sp. KR3021 TaxID=114890 RepID=A0AC35TKJ0_9BILA
MVTYFGQTLVVIIFVKFLYASDSCQKLAVCALENCIPASTGFPSKDKLIQTLLSKTNFACVFGPACYQLCSECKSCSYAQTQIKRIVSNEGELEGLCPKLEKCASSCLIDSFKDPFKCIFSTRCANYCLDNVDCPQCHDTVRRVFTGYCIRSKYNDHYQTKCRTFFTELNEQFVLTYKPQ